MFSILKKFFPTSSSRKIKEYSHFVIKINNLEPEIAKLSDDYLRNKTLNFKEQIANGVTIDGLLPEAFAVVREAAKRTLDMRHFDVQLMGGIALHHGSIAEMKTGEGKTLVSTLPSYLNALSGDGVHIVTVNDYLAKRDAEWMARIYEFLGMSVGVITSDISPQERKRAYNCDIVYGTNHEFGFDYLRDNMKFSSSDMVMLNRGFNYAIVDEIDSILIDESRTPLIISGPAQDSSDIYQEIDKIIPLLNKEDYEIDEKSKSCHPTDKGNERIEKLLRDRGLLPNNVSLYDISAVKIVHHVNQALKSHKLFRCDVDYIVKDRRVIIIDEFTGRMMDGRRFSEGLHQALEAKEGVPIQNENQTLASITYQNYFRMYKKLAGMTGTAMTEIEEFRNIYGLDVIEIPTNRSVQRQDLDDLVFKTEEEKFENVSNAVEEAHKKGQPVLIGTASIEKSEKLSRILQRKNIKHNVLNAKYHEVEAKIIAEAGRLGAVTIATNMAGRGTDIMLGGNLKLHIEQAINGITDEDEKKNIIAKTEENYRKEKESVLSAGGLFVLGSERHESRRIDNQLRGRSGRQGDPGKTQFYLSLQDDLLRIFGGEKIDAILSGFGFKGGEAMNNPLLNRVIAKAQKRVENYYYDIRKNLLKYDDVMNEQRKVIYDQRLKLIKADEITDVIEKMRINVNTSLTDAYIPSKASHIYWDLKALEGNLRQIYQDNFNVESIVDKEEMDSEEIVKYINDKTLELYSRKSNEYDGNLFVSAARRVLIVTIDELWKEHLYNIDHIREGINLRAYGQKDPLNEYKIDAFRLFEEMMTRLSELVITRLMHISISVSSLFEEENGDDSIINDNISLNMDNKQMIESSNTKPEKIKNSKIKRNESCPCGSGKKYKNCHGQEEN